MENNNDMIKTLSPLVATAGTAINVSSLIGIVNPFIGFFAGLAGLVAAIFICFQQYQKMKMNKSQRREADLSICKLCLDGLEPDICPLPKWERVKKCPKWIKQNETH